MTNKQCLLKGAQKAFYLTTNQVSSCCRAYGDQLNTNQTVGDFVIKWQIESQQLAQGIEIPSCKGCWTAEHQGHESYRTQNATWVPHEDIKITVDNACNQMCSYCSPKFSSTWQDSVQTHGPFLQISASVGRNLEPADASADTQYWINQISQYIMQQPDNSVSLTLLGGEPLMQLRNLQQLLELTTHKINSINITTNLNPPTNKFLVWAIDSLPKQKLKITVSIDACPDFNHVPRGLFDRSRFLNNLELLQKYDIPFEFSSVISVLSIFDVDRFLQWTEDTKITTEFYTLNNPVCLEPDLLPDFIKQQLKHAVNRVNAPKHITDILSRPSTGNQLKWFEQYHYLLQYFDRTGIDTTKVNNSLFQTWWKWLTDTVTRKKIAR